MKDISRRSLLNTSFASFGGFALPMFAKEIHTERVSNQGIEPKTLLWFEALWVRMHLWHFRNKLLPLLLRRPTMDANYHYVGFDAPNPMEMTAYRQATEHLIKAMPTNVCGIRIPHLDHDYIELSLNSLSGNFRDGLNWCRTREFVHHIENYCRLGEEGLQWDLQSRGSWFSQNGLDSCASEIADFILERKGVPNPVSIIQEASDSQLLRSFAEMPLLSYWKLIPPLFYIAPESPLTLLKVRQGNAIFRIGSFERDLEGGCILPSKMSELCGFLVRLFANNQFGRIRKVVALPESCGECYGYMAERVFDVLYQKVIFLRRLAAGEIDRLA